MSIRNETKRMLVLAGIPLNEATGPEEKESMKIGGLGWLRKSKDSNHGGLEGTLTISGKNLSVKGNMGFAYFKGDNLIIQDKYKFVNVTGNFMVTNSKVTSLEGAPKTVGDRYWIKNNTKLTSLKGGATKCGDFSLEYCNKITDLTGAPQTATSYRIANCKKLGSLKGLPKSTSGDLVIYETGLSSLVGAPTTINGDFAVIGNKITSLKGMPKKITGDFTLTRNGKTKFTEEEIREICNIGGKVVCSEIERVGKDNRFYQGED